MYEICANASFKGKFMCAPGFLVCAHLTSCVRAHAHSLQGTLPIGLFPISKLMHTDLGLFVPLNIQLFLIIIIPIGLFSLMTLRNEI